MSFFGRSIFTAPYRDILIRVKFQLLSLRTAPTERLRVLRFIEREFAQACHDVDPLGISVQRFLSRQCKFLEVCVWNNAHSCSVKYIPRY